MAKHRSLFALPDHLTYATHVTYLTHPPSRFALRRTSRAYLRSADAQKGRGSAFWLGQIWFSVSPSYSSPFFIT